MDELTFGTVYNDFYDGSTSNLGSLGVGAVRPAWDYSWDAGKARSCVCDGGWTGLNCASRMCPYGNDVMDTRLDRSDTLAYQVQTIVLFSGEDDGGQVHVIGGDDQHTWNGWADFVGLSFALRFTSKNNETYTTVPIGLTAASAAGLVALNNAVESALTNLPNKVIDAVSVSSAEVESRSGSGFSISVTFSGETVHGQQHLLEVDTNPCGDGCTPKISGLADTLVTNTNTTSYVVESTPADYNSFECGRRGKCDYDTGLCACFEGYTGEACSYLTALI